MKKITVLLAAYNGEKYLEQMIDSIIAQDHTEWHLVLSDDGSDDRTPEILKKYSESMPDQITLYRSGTRFGNPQQHFLHLIDRFHDTPYVMLCDQDDVWHTDKITKTYQKMQKIECDPDLPAMVHTDLRVVDSELNCISSSFIGFSGLSGNRLKTNQLLAQNVVTGCTMMINRSLAELVSAHPCENGVMMHDWWIALLASCCGSCGYLDEPTIDYRQHGHNSVGAKNVRSPKYVFSQIKSSRKKIYATFGQATCFLESFSSVLPNDKKEIISRYASLQNKGWLSRRIAYIKYGFWKNGFARKIAQLILG